MGGPFGRALTMALMALLVLSTSATGQVVRVDGGPDLADRIDAVALPYVDLGMFNGVILVAQGNEILFIEPYGKASYDLDVPLRTSTRFRIASLSKQFTNAALGTLMDRGEITPDATVSRFLPQFPNGDRITIEQLVNHTSGVPHTNELPELEGVTRMSLSAMIHLLANKGLDFEPGTQEHYSNGGYDLLAAIIERVSGEPYEAYLEHAVLEPLGLERTGRLHTYEVVPDLAQGYLPGNRPKSRSHARFYPAEIRIGGGSLYSTAMDVFTLFRATFQRSFAAETAPELLFWDATKRYEITGRSPGFVGKVFIDIPNDITIVSLANNYSALVSWGRRLYQAAIGDPWPSARLDPIRRTVPSDRAGYYEGDFASQWDRGTISVGPEGDLEYFDSDNDWEVALVPLAGDRWLHPFFDSICTFEGTRRAEAMICRPTLDKLDETTRFSRLE